MCADGEYPVVAAFAIETGEYQWSTCSPESVFRSIVAATEDAVYLSWYTTSEQTAAYSVVDGSEVPVDELPPDPDPASTATGNGFVIDGVRLEGGQDDPTRAFTDATGELLWEQPGVWPYDDVSAVGDGAVFALELPGRLVGYEVDSGDVRWEQETPDPYAASAWPWHVAGQRLFTLWFNVNVRSTIDGSLLWRTDYPAEPANPFQLRMSGVRANDTSVFVAFSAEPSMGD